MGEGERKRDVIHWTWKDAWPSNGLNKDQLLIPLRPWPIKSWLTEHSCKPKKKKVTITRLVKKVTTTIRGDILFMNGIKVFRTDYKGSFQGIKVFPSYKRLTKMQGLVLFRLQNSKKH